MMLAGLAFFLAPHAQSSDQKSPLATVMRGGVHQLDRKKEIIILYLVHQKLTKRWP